MSIKKLYFIKSHKKTKYNKKQYNKLFIIKICFIIILILYNIFKFLFNIKFFFNNIIFIISYLNKQIEYYNIQKLLLLYNNNKEIIKKYERINIPKISIISPIYNSEKYILRFMKSIRNQNFIDIEIILVDDCSFDNSVSKIEKYAIEDERIILIKNKRNKGTFVTRNIGVLFSKGKYIILPDPDDCLSKNMLKAIYSIAEKSNYEVIRFNSFLTSKREIVYHQFLKKLENKKVFQPELSTYIFYGFNELLIIDCYLSNKFFRKEVFIKALNYLPKKYLNMYNIYQEDQLMNYIIYRIAKSYFFFKKIGYYYIKNFESITSNKLFGKSELIIKCRLLFLNIVYENSKHTKYEKDMTNHLLSILIQFSNAKQMVKNIRQKEIMIYFYNLINKFLECKFINKENKYILKTIKNL